ncbi:MAG: multicopper oxidase family protein [Comamonas sp.]
MTSSLVSRRTLILAPAAALAASPAWLHAQMHDGMDHGSAGMSGMPGMSGHAGHSQPQAAATSGHGAEPLAPDSALPSGRPWRALTPLANSSRKPGVFRARLTAAPTQVEFIPGRRTEVWAYNGLTPGPLIEVREGDRVEIEFVNHLPHPSTIHWHGLPVPADQDGSPMDRVAPGARRLYRFTLPVGSAGTYWYHPHPHRMTAEQVFRGLAGALVVRAAGDPLAGLPERHLFVSDLKLTADGRIPPNTVRDWMNGREGQFALVNGQLRPLISGQGAERWRIWNASSARFLRLSLGGQAFAQVGTDGGLLPAARTGLTELLLAPAERAELFVSAADRARFELAAETYDRGLMDLRHMMAGGDAEHRRLPPAPRRVLAQIQWQPSAPSAPAVPTLPERLRAIRPLGEPRVQRQVLFTEAMDMEALHGVDEQVYLRPQGLAFQVNGRLYDMDRIDFRSRRGEVEQWDIVNATDMDHPFHIHGTQFQVVERVVDNVTTPEPVLAWRDTVNVRPAEIVRIRLAQEQPGLRMFHCHVLEHEDLGMMGNLLVE